MREEQTGDGTGERLVMAGKNWGGLRSGHWDEPLCLASSVSQDQDDAPWLGSSVLNPRI